MSLNETPKTSPLDDNVDAIPKEPLGLPTVLLYALALTPPTVSVLTVLLYALALTPSTINVSTL